MNKTFFLCVCILSGCLNGEPAFDLKTYERSLKKYIPWSLTGSAQNLRSDAKHQLQLMLRAFVLLRPEALWAEQPEPTVSLITEGFKGLKRYLAEKGNEQKGPWVVDSIAYIADIYVPEVQNLLDSVNSADLKPELSALLDKKKQLFKEFSQSLVAGRSEFAVDSNRKA